MDESACDAELLGILRRLLLSANSSDMEYRTLDRYLVAFFLSCTKHEMLQTLTWQHFVLVDEHVFTTDRLVDIGRNIRQIILGDLETETLTRLVFFSLPYLKHKRLNLPPLHETKFHELQGCLRIVYASCLGMLQRNSKKPPWSMRVQLHIFTHQLLVHGTHPDLHQPLHQPPPPQRTLLLPLAPRRPQPPPGPLDEPPRPPGPACQQPPPHSSCGTRAAAGTPSQTQP
jgi:hypothetical protein